MRGLNGKRAIVTGGGSGIGREVCKRFGEEGVEVGVFDMNAEGAAETVAEIGEGTYAQLFRCLHQRCKDVHRMDASLATAV